MEFLEEIINMLNKGNFEDVITKISNFLDENPHYKTIDYYHFANPLEELMFSENIEDINKVNVLGMDEPLEEIYTIYSIAYLILVNLTRQKSI